jgi:hypothetical protein
MVDGSVGELRDRRLNLDVAHNALRAEDGPIWRRSGLPVVDDRGAGRGVMLGYQSGPVDVVVVMASYLSRVAIATPRVAYPIWHVFGT